MTDDQIANAITNAINNGHQVVISTFRNAPDLLPHHAYVVTGTDPPQNPDKFLLYNPHGSKDPIPTGSNASILFVRLSVNIASFQILNNVPE